MLRLNLNFIFFTILAMASTMSIARDNRSVISSPQNPLMAKTDHNSSAALMVKKDNNNWDDYVAVGTIATGLQICEVFNHPFFKVPVKNYRMLDTINGQFRWEGIEASTLWIKKKFKDANAYSRSLSLDKNTLAIADQNFTACLKQIKIKNPKLFNFIKYRFLHYLKDDYCLEQRFRIKKQVDDNGNITKERIPLKKKSCINFNYNSYDYSYWNSTTFVLMLVWKEAHPVLSTIFENGNKIINARIIKRKKVIEKKRLAEEKKKIESQKQKESYDKSKQAWLVYISRKKTLMEQVYNFSTTGDLEGLIYNHWIEVKPCILSNGRKKVDNRKINMTAFRIYSKIKNKKIQMISSDNKYYFSTYANISIDRLQKAWKLAFDKCPGKTSRF